MTSVDSIMNGKSHIPREEVYKNLGVDIRDYDPKIVLLDHIKYHGKIAIIISIVSAIFMSFFVAWIMSDGLPSASLFFKFVFPTFYGTPAVIGVGGVIAHSVGIYIKRTHLNEKLDKQRVTAIFNKTQQNELIQKGFKQLLQKSDQNMQMLQQKLAQS